ncbi:MAG: PilZ domain-containing protein [Kangiellaceae bacterium]|nr:PilZ domain-containing protein [Kangiellaceae bacterium]
MSEDQSLEERREYFRIKNWIILNYEVVESLESVPNFQSLIDEESPRITLLQELTRLENENQAYLGSLKEKQSQLGDYLLNMNKKFELLTRFVIQSLTDNSQELTEVDISGGGIRFSTKSPHPMDTLIKMEIVLVPECVGIIAYGRVVDCKKIDDSDNYDMAVVFVKLREADRDAIVKHVFKIQSRQLRQNVPNSEETDN